MVQMIKKIDGQEPRIVKEYSSRYSLEDAKRQFTQNYRCELNEKSNVTYISSLEEELALLNEGLDKDEDAVEIENNRKYIANIDFRGSGYYSVWGDCLLIDGELKSYIKEDNVTWELKERAE